LLFGSPVSLGQFEGRDALACALFVLSDGDVASTFWSYFVRWYFVVIIFLYCSLIFGLSSRPVPEILPSGIMNLDKLAHAVCFGGLAFLVAIGLRFSGRAYSSRTLFWAPLLFAIFYGATDEFHQYFIPYRTHDVWDWVADGVGALMVVSAIHLIARFSKKTRALRPA
jgi:VanZ family protein